MICLPTTLKIHLYPNNDAPNMISQKNNYSIDFPENAYMSPPNLSKKYWRVSDDSIHGNHTN